MGNVMNFGRLATQAAAVWGDRPAVVWRDKTWTWSDLNARVDALTAALRDLGVRKGDRVLVQARNSNQLVETGFAVFKAGAVWVPVNYRLMPQEVAGLAETARPVAMIRDDVFADHAAAVRAAVPSLSADVVIGAAQPDATEYEGLIDRFAGAAPFEEDMDRDDPLWFFFTSGTTGRPKASVLTHGQMAFVVTNHVADLMPGLSHESGSLVVAPLSHGAGMHLFVNAARGAKSVLLPSDRLDVETAWRLVEEHRLDNMFTVPTIVKMLTEHRKLM